MVVGVVLECKKHPNADKLLVSKVDTKDKEAQQYMNLLKKLDNLKVFMSSSAKVSAEMKSTVTSYLKTNPLEELMRVSEDGKKVNIYVKSGTSENIVKELLMFIEDPSSKALKVGEVSSVPLLTSFTYVALIAAKSASAFAIFSNITLRNSSSSSSL